MDFDDILSGDLTGSRDFGGEKKKKKKQQHIHDESLLDLCWKRERGKAKRTVFRDDNISWWNKSLEVPVLFHHSKFFRVGFSKSRNFHAGKEKNQNYKDLIPPPYFAFSFPGYFKHRIKEARTE